MRCAVPFCLICHLGRFSRWPSLILQRLHPNGVETNEHYVDDAESWKWIGALMQIGVHAFNDPKIKEQLPAELFEYWEKRHAAKENADADEVKKD